MWQQWVNTILGLVVVAVPFLELTATTFVWTLVIVGLAIAALGVWGAQEASSERERGRMAARHPRHT